MRDERLYIDGQLVDIDDNTKITLNIKSNLFRDVSQITANNTYTVKLPKTVRNQMIMQHVDLVSANNGYPYMLHSARFFRNGVEVIKDGKATILSVTEDTIEVSIIWGLWSAFSDLVSKGTALNELESDDAIMFNNSTTLPLYDDVKDSDYFYAYYDVWVKTENTEKEWTSKEWREGDSGSVTTRKTSRDVFSFDESRGGRRGTQTTYSYLHPVVKVNYILDLIKTNTGVEFAFEDSAQEDISSLVVPLVNKKSNELTFEKSFSAKLLQQSVGYSGALPATIESESNVFNASKGATLSMFKVLADAKVILNLTGTWQFDITGHYSAGWSNRGDSIMETHAFQSKHYVRVAISGGDEEREYKMGNDSSIFYVSVPKGTTGIVSYEMSANGTIEVYEGEVVSLEWVYEGNMNSCQFMGGTMGAYLQSDDNVPSGGYFPIAYNLPSIKIIDFVKFLACITGTFPLQEEEKSRVRFVPFSTVWDNKAEAKDWTRRIVAQNVENKPKGLEFVMSQWGQHNLYKWKDDDKVSGNYDGDLTIANNTLETEKTIFEFPFSAADGFSVPMYEKTTDAEEGRTTGESTETTTAITYSKCNDKILRLVKGSKGYAGAYFDMDMQDILDEKYSHIKQSLQNTKIVKEQIRIRDLELINFDETKPVYLAQYGSYFAVTEIKADESGLAEVTMLQLYFDTL